MDARASLLNPGGGEPASQSLRTAHKNVTRNRVLDAAVTVFGEKSFVDATMGDIAEAAGVTRVTVYAHFPGKGEIIQALSARLYDVADEVYAELAALPEWTPAAIRGWLDASVERCRRLAPTIRVVAAAVPTMSRDYSDSRNRHVTMLAGDARRWRGVSAAEARQRVLLAMLQVESFQAVWLVGGWPPDTGDPLDLLTDAVCHLLAPALETPRKEER